jgi:hypothetical protein
VYIYGGAGTVTNSGEINATGYRAIGVDLTNGGSVTNEQTGGIGGSGLYGVGVSISGAAGTVANLGEITGASGIGIYLHDGGNVVDELGGMSDSVVVNAGGKVTNHGAIMGFVAMPSGGAVTNGAGGSITGGVAFNTGEGTVDNAGSIVAAGGSAEEGICILMDDGGKVNNLKGGDIDGTQEGVLSDGAAAATVTNSGVIIGGPESLGVDLEGGGEVTNYAGAAIDGVGVLGPGTIVNAGSITSIGTTHEAVNIQGGKVTNEAGGTIGGYEYGVNISLATGTVTNAGAIYGTYSGVGLGVGGSVTNEAGGKISGEQGSGVFISNGGASGMVTNAGAITGKNYGVEFTGGGTATNAAGGTISSEQSGVAVINGAGTVTNAGTISGSYSVSFYGTGANTLVLDTGSVLTGAASGSTASGATNALVLKGSGAANNAFLNFDTLSVQATGTWKLGGESSFSQTTVSTGTLDFEDAVTGAGSDTISGAAALVFGSTVTDSQTIDFTDSGGLLVLFSPSGFAGELSGFDTVGSNDAVELLGSWSISGFSTTSTQSTLTLSSGNDTASLVFDGGYSKTHFDATVSAGHTTITYT